MRKIDRISKFFLCLLSVGLFADLSSALNYECYLESWDQQWPQAMQGLPATPGSNSTQTYQGTILNISFGAYIFPGLNGLQFTNVGDVGSVISYVQSQGGKVKISFGGASYAPPFYPNYFISQTTADGGWPANIPQLAAGVIDVINTNYGTPMSPLYLDGVDFDIEDPQPATINGLPYTAQDFANDLMTFLNTVRAGLPAGKILSITIPGQGWNTYWELLAKQATVDGGPVDYVSFMEYDIYVSSGISLVQQIEGDLLTYTSSSNQSLPPNWAPGWGINPAKIQLGLMPANDDIGNILTLEGASTLTSVAADNNYGKPLFGVMIWDLDRDALTDVNPLPTELTPPPYQYSNIIRQTIANPVATANLHPFRKKRLKRTIETFIRQAVPPHGNPV